MTFCSTLFSDNVQSLLFEEVPVRVKIRHQLKKKDVSASRGTLGVNAPGKDWQSSAIGFTVSK